MALTAHALPRATGVPETGPGTPPDLLRDDQPEQGGKAFASVLDGALTNPRARTRERGEPRRSHPSETSRRAPCKQDAEPIVGSNAAVEFTQPMPVVRDHSREVDPSAAEASKKPIPGNDSDAALSAGSALARLLSTSLPDVVPLPPSSRGQDLAEAQVPRAGPVRSEVVELPGTEKVADAATPICPVPAEGKIVAEPTPQPESRPDLASLLAPIPSDKPGADVLKTAENPAPAATGDKPTPNASRGLALVPESGGAGGAADGGMFVAQGPNRMNAGLTANEFAALTADSSPAPESAAPLRIPVDLGRSRGAARLAPDMLHVMVDDARLPEATGAATPSEAPQPAVMSRLCESIGHEAALMRNQHPDSLAVILKPDERTEIFIRLDVRGGELQALARCERGDFQLLSAHWGELQRSLKEQGVHLQPLQQRPECLHVDFGSAGSSSEHPGRFRFTRPQETETPVSAARSLSRSGSARRVGTMPRLKRLLESWA